MAIKQENRPKMNAENLLDLVALSIDEQEWVYRCDLYLSVYQLGSRTIGVLGTQA